MSLILCTRLAKKWLDKLAAEMVSYDHSGWKGPQEVSSVPLLKAGPVVRSDQTDQVFLQLDLENLQGQSLHNLPEQPEQSSLAVRP